MMLLWKQCHGHIVGRLNAKDRTGYLREARAALRL